MKLGAVGVAAPVAVRAVCPLVVIVADPLFIVIVVGTDIPHVIAVTFKLFDPSIDRTMRLSGFGEREIETVPAVAQKLDPVPVPSCIAIK